MPKSRLLSDVACRGAKYPEGRKGPFLIADGAGLNLQIMSSGSKSWLFRYMIGGRARMLGLGPYPEVSLALAREEATKWRGMLKKGRDPADVRKAEAAEVKQAAMLAAANAVTFERAATEYLETHSIAWRNAKHRAQWSATLSSYAFPMIGSKPVGEIDLDDVIGVLKPIWTKIPETASRLRGRVEQILDYAESRGWRSSGSNPAAWKVTRHRLPIISKVRRVEHHPALPWQQIASFMDALNKKDGMAARALSFIILTACRSGEARGAIWSEIDLKNKLWIIPKSRMKASQEHRVALSSAAVSLLQQVMPFSKGPESFVFPSIKAGKMISDMTMTMLIRGMNENDQKWVNAKGRPIVTHGFRSTFRDWAEEATSTPRAVVERALAHKVANQVEAAYLQTDLLEMRRGLMEEWSKECSMVKEFQGIK